MSAPSTQGVALSHDSLIAVSTEKIHLYFEHYSTLENVRIIDMLAAWVAERGHAIVKLVIARFLAEPMISSIIAGAGEVAYVEINVRASEWKLMVEDGRDSNDPGEQHTIGYSPSSSTGKGRLLSSWRASLSI